MTLEKNYWLEFTIVFLWLLCLTFIVLWQIGLFESSEEYTERVKRCSRRQTEIGGCGIYCSELCCKSFLQDYWETENYTCPPFIYNKSIEEKNCWYEDCNKCCKMPYGTVCTLLLCNQTVP